MEAGVTAVGEDMAERRAERTAAHKEAACGAERGEEANGMAGSRRYDDIMDLPRHISAVHPPMPVADRAAQFMPFAALTGFGSAIEETGRLTEERLELEEDAIEGLEGKLQYLRARVKEHPEISVTYFRPDARKAGGAYVTAVGRIGRIDLYERMLVMEDGTGIPMKSVVGLDGEVFSDLEG